MENNYRPANEKRMYVKHRRERMPHHQLTTFGSARPDERPKVLLDFARAPPTFSVRRLWYCVRVGMAGILFVRSV